MAKIDQLSDPEQFKVFLHDSFEELIKHLQESEATIIETYKSNPTWPFDYYNLLLREIETKIACKREVYKYLTDEELV